MSRLLMTQSLLSSWNYLFSCREESCDNAFDEFMQTLNRIPSVPNEAMLDGIEFEDEVYKVISGSPRKPHEKWENGIQLVAAKLRGAPTQVVTQQEIDIMGHPLLLYGKLDAVKAGTIYDVKKIVKSFGTAELAGKYLDSPQHPMYLRLVPEAHDFHYLVSDGIDLYEEVYTRANTSPIEVMIQEFLVSIETMGLMPIYQEKWGSK